MEGQQKSKVFIFKAESEKEPDPYEEELAKVGFKPQLVPVITFSFFDLHILREKLENHDKYCGLILSSERCVAAVQKATENSPELLLDPWKKKFVICAGEATAEKTRNSLGLNPLLGDKHRAEGMIELLAKMEPIPKLMLYPCGELAANKDTMASGLALNNIGCEPTPVYKTLPNPNLKSSLENLFSSKQELESTWPKILVFFSPSGLKAVIENCADCESLNSCKLVSIGPTTAAAIRENNMVVWAEADAPNPSSLREAIEKAMN